MEGEKRQSIYTYLTTPKLKRCPNSGTMLSVMENTGSPQRQVIRSIASRAHRSTASESTMIYVSFGLESLKKKEKRVLRWVYVRAVKLEGSNKSRKKPASMHS